MDSDDDFNSSMSGEDFEDQDSDLGIEDGMYKLRVKARYRTHIWL